MAHGFLQSFDARLDVHSAGTEPGSNVNHRAVKVMGEAGIDISNHFPKSADIYTGIEWDYVITVCDSANALCPVFSGRVKHRLHIGFEDPSHALGTEEFVMEEFRRVRDLIKKRFYELYVSEMVPVLK